MMLRLFNLELENQLVYFDAKLPGQNRIFKITLVVCSLDCMKMTESIARVLKFLANQIVSFWSIARNLQFQFFLSDFLFAWMS